MAAAEGTFIPWFKPLILQMREAEVFGGYVRGQWVSGKARADPSCHVALFTLSGILTESCTILLFHKGGNGTSQST